MNLRYPHTWVYDVSICVWQWWEGELERRYLLHRARCLHNAYAMHGDTPTVPVPAYLHGRVAAGQALPSVDVVGQQAQLQAGASGNGGASMEECEERHAMLAYVVVHLNAQLFTELIEAFHAPR